MFCPKCGNQLPDGAAFCTSCGSSMNPQSATPVTPATPATPVAEPTSVPVMNEAPVTNEEPIFGASPVTNNEPIFGTTPATNGEPIFGAATPVMNETPSQAPMNGQFVPQSQGSYSAPVPGQMQQTAFTPKKSKAPLFIGLAMGILLIAIVAIIIVMVVTGGDDDDKESKTTGSTETTSATERESTTEPETDDPMTNAPSGDVDLSDAEDVIDDFLSALEFEDSATAADLVLPSMGEALEGQGLDMESYVGLLVFAFYDPEYNFLDYTIKSAEEYDGASFYDTYYDDIKSMSSYVDPTAFASVEVEFTYEDQASSMFFHLAYCDGEFYFYHADDENFNLDFEQESTSDITTGGDVTIDVADSLSSNYMTINAEPSGTRTSFEGYSIIIPDGWVESGALYCSPDYMTNFTVTSDSALSLYTPEDLFELLISQYALMDATITEIGNLETPYTTGYYIEYTIVSNGMTFSGTQLVYENNGTTYYVTVTADDPDSDDAANGLRAAASIQFE